MVDDFIFLLSYLHPWYRISKVMDMNRLLLKLPLILCTIFFIGFSTIFLTSCAGTPRKFLASDAAFIKKGQPQEKIVQLLGPPDAKRITKDNLEEWYYYQENSRFYHRIPLLGHHLGNPKVDVLQVTFRSGYVVKTIYYVTNK